MIRVLQFGMSLNRGGIETFLFNYYKNMDHKKVQFDFVKYSFEKIPFEDEIIAMGGRIYEFRPCGMKRSYLKNRKQWIELLDKAKPDVIHYNTIALSSLHALIYAKKKNVPMRIAHIHSNYYLKEKLSFKTKTLIKINKYLVNMYTTNLWACSLIAGRWAFSDKFEVIPNAIDLRRFKFNIVQREYIRKKLCLGDRIVICNSGKLSEVKNQNFLLDIFIKIKETEKNISLLLLGDGMIRNDLIRKAKKMGIENDVIFMGNVLDVENYLSASDLFVFPSKSEGFGSALLEAQANGLKCFASSDVIPMETNVMGNITFLSLNESPDYWSKVILRSLPIHRNSTDNIEMMMRKYDIKYCARELQERYLEYFNE